MKNLIFAVNGIVFLLILFVPMLEPNALDTDTKILTVTGMLILSGITLSLIVKNLK